MSRSINGKSGEEGGKREWVDVVVVESQVVVQLAGRLSILPV